MTGCAGGDDIVRLLPVATARQALCLAWEQPLPGREQANDIIGKVVTTEEGIIK